MENISWKIIDKYFKDNPNNLTEHHLDSYNDFIGSGIQNILRENNPIRFIENESKENENKRNEVHMYLGGKTGNKVYFGKPIIYDESSRGAHYMYPNDARIRNMTYGMTINYDVEIDMIYYTDDGEKKVHQVSLEKIYLGKIPIMLNSNYCILKNLSKEVKFNMGECRNDFGGYFVIDGKEKSVIPQEKFANNMLYIRKNKSDDVYSYSAEIRSVSEDASKAVRTVAIKVVAPTSVYSNNQIVVLIPNVRKEIPLFILMRALGVLSDKSIIEYCLLELETNESYVDLFVPSVHDANKIFNQESALKYIASFTKRRTISGVIDILMNYFLPHIGENNFLDKAYFVGYIVNKLLRVFTGEVKPTDRDSFSFKRIELVGSLLYDLFREYYLIQKRDIELKIDKEYYYHKGNYEGDNFINLVENNYRDFFKDRLIETGIRKAFKGNWGSKTYTKRVGVVQDLNRLSWNSFISQLRKLNLPLDASAKVVGPRLLNSTQWGFIDPLDTPDGGNIGLHKHLAITTIITSGTSCWPIIKWLRAKTPIRILQECTPKILNALSKVLVNGIWIGGIENPIEFVKMLKLIRRNGLIPIYTSISFNYENKEIHIYTDGGRLMRPVYYLEDGKLSFKRDDVMEKLKKGDFTWGDIVSGFNKKLENYNFKTNKIYDVGDLYPSTSSKKKDSKNSGSSVNSGISDLETELQRNKSIIDYIDTSEEEGLLIANSIEDFSKSKYYTNLEIDPSLILGVMGNLIVYPENNPFPRNAFSCGQSKQAVSLYHSNFQMRFDKMGVVLNYGQVPLLKSRYLEYLNNEQQPYGVNTIVAIMCYTGYNVEDAILINEGSVNRGLFRTTYYTTYEAREESSSLNGTTANSVFSDVSKKQVRGLKPGYDYSYLDKWGIIKENTEINDKIVLIGKVTSDSEDSEVVSDSSVFTKKGQLGFVDKVFITEGEEGFRIAKVRIREERLPAMGDKMASRIGQKGTIGLIIPEENMPFTADGVRPDLIINPHALPSRMTIGQLVEMFFGKSCLSYGGFGDATAFATKGANTKLYGSMLVKSGFNSSGNQILYNGMTGEQLYSEIFIGPTYYLRLKHMVKDKINYRALGPRTLLSRQPVQGRANDGGLRIGEMERDGVMGHGASAFLNDSFMIRGDEYYMAVCNKTGGIAIYNNSMNLFMSPFADGPVKFNETMDGKMNIENISRFGRSFSLLRIPYSFKLLIQELQAMNVQMRIITEDNIDNLLNLSYSDNINKLVKSEEDLNILVMDYKSKLITRLKEENAVSNEKQYKQKEMYAQVVQSQDLQSNITPEGMTPPLPSELQPFEEVIIEGLPPGTTTPENSPPISSDYIPASSDTTSSLEPILEGIENTGNIGNIGQEYIPMPIQQLQGVNNNNIMIENIPQLSNSTNPNLKYQFDSLSERDKKILMEMLAKKRAEKARQVALEEGEISELEKGTNILNIEKEKDSSKDTESENSSSSSLSSSSSSSSSNNTSGSSSSSSSGGGDNTKTIKIDVV